MATKAEIAEIIQHAWGMMLSDPLDEIGFEDLAHTDPDPTAYSSKKPHVLYVYANGERFRITVSKPRR